jgi:hypothetical protein
MPRLAMASDTTMPQTPTTTAYSVMTAPRVSERHPPHRVADWDRRHSSIARPPVHGARQVTRSARRRWNACSGVQMALRRPRGANVRNRRLACAVGSNDPKSASSKPRTDRLAIDNRPECDYTRVTARRALTSVQAIEESEAFVVRVDVGTSDTKARRFRPGGAAATLTVGSQGAWKVEAPGVASVHAYLRFDGRQLLVATSDPRRPVVIDGQPLPETWSLLQPPCLLNLGQACLSVERSFAEATPPSPALAASTRALVFEEEATCRRSVPPLAPGGQIAAEHDASLDDLPPAEATRLQFGPLESPDRVGTRAVQVSSLPPALLDSAPATSEGELDSSGSIPPPPFQERDKRVRRLLQTGGLVLGLAVVIGGAYRLASPRKAAVSGGTSPAAGQRANVPAAGTPRPASPLAVTVSPAITAPLFVAPEPLSAAPSGVRGQNTPERRAADAFAAGDFPTALRLYRDLAAAHPEQPAFRQAVRILEEK